MAPRSKSISQQVMVLTGASSGIGLCTAQLAGLLGARLVLMAGNSQAMSSLVGVIESSGGQAMHVAADVRVRAQMVAAAQAAVDRFGCIDTWVNNAGLDIYGRLDEVSEADSRRLFDFNFWGVVNGSLAALPHLFAARGSLINVGSEIGDGAAPLQGMYASSKYAVKGFTDALRLETSQSGGQVSISLIEPAGMDSGAGIDPMRVAEAILAAASAGGDLQARAARKLLPQPGAELATGADSQPRFSVAP
jgi:NADP-dependent 3-hydroxy acid dehydrogenase YdfG